MKQNIPRERLTQGLNIGLGGPIRLIFIVPDWYNGYMGGIRFPGL